MEWAVEGRELATASCGRGGSGGGVPSLEGKELADVLREKVRIIFSVGFAKSCCSIRSADFAFIEALLLFCVRAGVGVVGSLVPSEAGV